MIVAVTAANWIPYDTIKAILSAEKNYDGLWD